MADSLTIRKKLGQNLLLSFVSLLLALAAAEIFVRIFIPLPPLQAPRPKILVHEASENLKLLYKPSPNTSNTTYGVLNQINSAGFRDREYPLQKPAGTKRFIFLGDSVVYGYGVLQEDSIPKQLEKNLRERGRAAEVLNLGVSGYDTEQAVEFFKEVGLPFKPDVVLLGYTLNDCSYASMELDFFHDRLDYHVHVPTHWLSRFLQYSHLMRFLDLKFHLQQRFKPLRPYRRLSIWHFIEDRNHAIQDPLDSPYQQLRAKIEAEGRQAGAAPESIKNMMSFVGIGNDPMYSSHWNAFRADLKELSELSKKYHFKVVAVIFPYLADLDHYALTSVHKYVAQEFRELGFGVIDLEPFVRQEYLIYGRRLYNDPIHFSPLGASRIGSYLEQEIAS